MNQRSTHLLRWLQHAVLFASLVAAPIAAIAFASAWGRAPEAAARCE